MVFSKPFPYFLFFEYYWSTVLVHCTGTPSLPHHVNIVRLYDNMIIVLGMQCN